MPLTDLACKNAKPKDKPYKLADSQGLYLSIQPNGSKYWRINYRFLGKQKSLALGVYPETSLGMAREQCQAARKQLANGIDPSQAKKDTKHERLLNASNTFEAVGREWLAHYQDKWSSNHAATIVRRLDNDVFPVIGHRPIRDLKSSDMLMLARKIESRGAYEITRRAMQVCSQIFRYAVITNRAEYDPVPALKDALKPYKRGHYAALSPRELPDFLKALDQNDIRAFPQTLIALELLMYTFVRTSELIKATWNEFDLENMTWEIPAERMKMRRPHIVPLSRQVMERLHRLRIMHPYSKYILPSVQSHHGHMGNNTVLVALERMGYKGRMTGHGFRALAMTTIKEKMGNYRHEVIDRQLAHAHKSQVVAAYDRAEFLDERRVMMQDWADYLDNLRRDA